jgi:uncharacterized protein
MDFIADPSFYFVAIPAALIFGMSKGGFGGAAGGTIAVPLMALTVDPLTAAAVMLPVLLVMDATALWKFRGKYALGHLKIMLPAAIVGITLAGLVMHHISADGLRLFLGLIAVCFCLYYWFMPKDRKKKPGKLAGYFWSMVSGFTSTQIHAGAVPAGIYLYPQQLDKVILTGTMAIFFAVVNVVKLIPYTLLGQFSLTNLGTSLILLPVAPVGVLLGHRLLHLVSQVWIYRILYVCLLVAGTKLMYEGLT